GGPMGKAGERAPWAPPAAAPPADASPFSLASCLSTGTEDEKQLAKEERQEVESSEPVGVSEPEPSTLLPAAPASSIPCEVKQEEVVIELGDRRYRVRGLAKNLSYDALKVNLLVSRCAPSLTGGGEGFHVDTIDLYAARPRAAFVKQAAIELGVKEDVVQRDVGRVLLKLEELQDQAIRKALEPEASTPAMTEGERERAMALLRDPRLLERIVEDLERCGLVGETTNKLVTYLAAVSRKQERPLAVLIQSSSAAGKSALMNAVLALVP